jgi:HSP20 family protein
LTDKWWRWKKRSEWDEFSKEFDKLEKMVDDTANDSTKPPSEKEEKESAKPRPFGFSVSHGPAGKPQVHRFGSLQPPLQGTQIKRDDEPLLDILDCKREIIVIAELLGVNRNDVKLDLSEYSLRVSVDTPERSFYKVVRLPARVCAEFMQTSYKNGVLELRLKKASRKLLMKNRLIPGV